MGVGDPPNLVGSSPLPARWLGGGKYPSNSPDPTQHPQCDNITQKWCHHIEHSSWRCSGLGAKLNALMPPKPDHPSWHPQYDDVPSGWHHIKDIAWGPHPLPECPPKATLVCQLGFATYVDWCRFGSGIDMWCMCVHTGYWWQEEKYNVSRSQLTSTVNSEYRSSEHREKLPSQTSSVNCSASLHHVQSSIHSEWFAAFWFPAPQFPQCLQVTCRLMQPTPPQYASHGTHPAPNLWMASIKATR